MSVKILSILKNKKNKKTLTLLYSNSHFHHNANMFREKAMRNIPLIPSLFFLICISLAFGAKSISMLKRSTYIVYMDKSHMPKAFSSHHYMYSSLIDSFKFANLDSPYSNVSSPSLLYTLTIMLFMALALHYLQKN